MNNSICPYTGLQISDIESNREHIVPDALGGPNGFALRADSKLNSHYGSTVDSRLVHDMYLKFKAVEHGLSTRSGAAVFRVKGHAVVDGAPVDAELTHTGLKLINRVPVVKDVSDPRKLTIRGFGDDAKRQLERVAADAKKKGLTLVTEGPFPLDSTVRASVTHRPMSIVQGLGKIAYLMTVRTLGDAFIGTQGAAQYRRWLDAEPTHEGLVESGLQASWPSTLGYDFNTLPEHFHILTCLAMNGGVITFVRLFNDDKLSFMARADLPDSGNWEPQVKFITIDSLNKTFEETWE